MEVSVKKFFKSLLATLVAFSSILLIPVPLVHAAADTCTWTGATNNLWSVGTNWSGCDNGGVPEAGDSLIFPAGASNISMSNDQGALIYQAVTVTGPGYTFSGNNIIVSDTWQITSANNLISANIGFTNTASATLAISGGATGNNLDGNIILNLTAGADMNLSIDADINHNGAITGTTDSLQEIGTGTWITSSTNASSFTSSGVNISSGYFQCRNNNCFGANANNVSNNSGGAIQFNNGVLTIANNIVLGSSTSPQLNVLSGTPTLTGTFTVNATGTVYVQAATLVVSGAITLNADLYTNGTNATSSNILLNGNISGASTGNIITDNSFVGISGNNATYTRNITAMPGSVIEAYSSDSLGDTVGTTTISSGATLYADSTITVDAEPIKVSGTGVGTGNFLGAIVSNLNDRTYTGPITLAGDTTFYAAGGGELIIDATISGSGNLNIESSNASSFVTFDGSSANTYVGTTYVVDGELQLIKDPGVIAIPGNLIIDGTIGLSQVQINNAEQIADSANINMLESVAFNAQLQTDAETIGSLSGAGSIYIVQNTLNVGGDNSSTTYSGSITTNNIVPGTLNKQGTGTLTLSGTTSAGNEPNFTVEGGILKVMTNYATSPFTANSGGTLKGTGSIGNTTINSGSTFNVGNSPGCMTVANLTLTSGANFDEEIAGNVACTDYDQTTVTGTADLNNATLNIIPSFTPTAGTSFTIIQAANVTGTFNGLPNGSTITASGIQFRVNYTSTTVTLTALGGTLAQTGINTSQLTLIAILIILTAVGGLILERKTRRHHASKK
jgi:hypothetical protein